MAASKTSAGIGIPVQSVVVHRTTQITATLAAIGVWYPPVPVKVVGITVVSRAKGGTHSATLFEVKVGATVVGSVDVAAVAAGTAAPATVSNPDVAADAKVQVDVTVTGGTSPTLDDVDVQIDYIPRG